MTSAALQFEKMKTVERLLPPRGRVIYPSGINDRDKGFVLYGPKSSDQPTLIIIDPIYDEDRNVILPGYYELMLSEDRKTLLLTQQQEIVAIVPVFKIEEDRTQEKMAQPMDNKSQRKFDKEQKKKLKKNKKLMAEGKMPEEPAIYNNATIEYDIEKDYYLIKYERGKIKAWGALKI